MVPTSTGRDEALGTPAGQFTDSAGGAGYPEAPFDQAQLDSPAPAPTDPAAAEPGDAGETPSAATDDQQPLLKPARPRFRAPRSRSRRPEPDPFALMASDDAPDAGFDSPATESPASPADQENPPARRRGRQGSRTRTTRPPAAQRVSGVAGWKIATAVLTAVAVVAVGWAVYQTTRLNRTESALKVAGSTAASQIQSLDSRTAALEASNSQTASDLATLQQQFTDFTGAVAAAQQAAKDQYAKVQESLSVTPADFKTAVAQSTALSTAYLTAKAAADAAPADQEAQLKSLEAKSALLANCTKIWAGAAQQVYTADNPQDAMSTVGKDLATVAGDCKAVNG